MYFIKHISTDLPESTLDKSTLKVGNCLEMFDRDDWDWFPIRIENTYDLSMLDLEYAIIRPLSNTQEAIDFRNNVK